MPAFSAAAELDGDLLIHVLAQVEDVFLLGALRLAMASSASSTAVGSPAASTATAPSPTVAASAAAATECASLRHGVLALVESDAVWAMARGRRDVRVQLWGAGAAKLGGPSVWPGRVPPSHVRVEQGRSRAISALASRLFRHGRFGRFGR